MPATTPFRQPVSDSIARVDNEVAVGENLDFQRRWWRFEQIVWICFALILLADLLGAFGRGWLAKAESETPGGALHLKYERIERASTPSILSLQFGPQTIREGRIQLFVNAVKDLGAQRIIPQPETSTVGDGGITYTFPATAGVAEVNIALEPSFPGVHRLELRVPGSAPINVRIAVLP
jgi:hypothetical protein